MPFCHMSVNYSWIISYLLCCTVGHEKNENCHLSHLTFSRQLGENWNASNVMLIYKCNAWMHIIIWWFFIIFFLWKISTGVVFIHHRVLYIEWVAAVPVFGSSQQTKAHYSDQVASFPMSAMPIMCHQIVFIMIK